MKKRIIIIAISICAVIAIGVGGFFYSQRNKFVYNNDNAVGNTTGNLNNGGTFCEYNGYIYFANPSDNFYLYRMNSDCTDAKKLNSDSVAYLNVCGNYIYYVKHNEDTSTSNKNGFRMTKQLIGIYRTDLNGKNPETLYDDLSGIISLYGNYLYYQHYSTTVPLNLYKLKIDGKEDIQLSDTAYNPACMNNGIMYFVDTNNKNTIGAYNISTGKATTFYNANAYMVNVLGNYLYYIDVSKGYSLVRLNITTKTVELLYSNDGKIVNFNVYGTKVFFQMEGDQPGLYRMNTDGTQVEFVASGNLNNLQCTSNYTFFQYFENDKVLYRIPTTGPITKVEEISIK